MAAGTPRIQTYISGLDTILGGGIPTGSVVLMQGTAGTMKSTLCYAILYQNVLRTNAHVLYMTLEQPRKDLEEQMDELGMPRETQPGLQKRLAIVDLGELRGFLSETGEGDMSTDWFKSVLRQLRTFKEEFPVSIFVLDSVNALLSLHNKDNPRVELFHFIRELRSQGMTSILIDELGPDSGPIGSNQVDYLVDGIIRIEAKRVDEMVNMQLGVVKMRKTAHNRAFRPLIVSRGRFEIVGT